jgi:hypothetical protein
MMTDPKQDVAAAYGEGDAEAKAMTEVARKGPRTDPDARKEVPPPDTFVPAAGTTETDVARNLREKAARESKS